MNNSKNIIIILKYEKLIEIFNMDENEINNKELFVSFINQIIIEEKENINYGSILYNIGYYFEKSNNLCFSNMETHLCLHSDNYYIQPYM